MFNLSSQIEALKSSLVGYILLMASTIIGLIWISISLYSASVRLLGGSWGPAVVGFLFLLPIVVYLLAKAMAPKDKRTRQQRLMDEAIAASPVGALSKIIETMSAQSPFWGAVAAIVGGFIATRYPQYLTVVAELVTAGAEELKRRKAQKAARPASSAYTAREASPPPPPDVEPVVKRRRRKVEYDY